MDAFRTRLLLVYVSNLCKQKNLVTLTLKVSRLLYCRSKWFYGLFSSSRHFRNKVLANDVKKGLIIKQTAGKKRIGKFSASRFSFRKRVQIEKYVWPTLTIKEPKIHQKPFMNHTQAKRTKLLELQRRKMHEKKTRVRSNENIALLLSNSFDLFACFEKEGKHSSRLEERRRVELRLPCERNNNKGSISAARYWIRTLENNNKFVSIAKFCCNAKQGRNS